jgi:hypothetical protein
MRISARLLSEASLSIVNHVPSLATRSVFLTTVGTPMVLRPRTHSPLTCRTFLAPRKDANP